MSELMLDVGQANELKMALRREGAWTNEEIKMLCERKGLLTSVHKVLLGRAEIKPIEYLIDFDKPPSIPDGWTLLPDSEQLPKRVRGLVRFDPAKINLYLDDGQKNGRCIEGNKLRKELEAVAVYGAQYGDFLYMNQDLIPEEWKGKAIFFWGSIYRDAGDYLYVRDLYWRGDRWVWDFRWLGYDWQSNSPAAVPCK